MDFAHEEIDVVQMYAPRYSLGAVVTPEFIESVTGKWVQIPYSPTEGPNDYDKLTKVLNEKLKKYRPELEIENYPKWYVRFNKIRVGTRFDQDDGIKHKFPHRLSYCTLDGIDSYEFAMELAKKFDQYLTEQESLRKKKKR